MATGIGKSLLFMLPASLSPGGVTVVIAPLNALRDNLQDRCDLLSIPCAKWDGKRPPYWASIILVTPEGAVSAAFGRFIDEKRMLRQLDRIVIDECHVLMDSSESWRPDVLRLTEMTEKSTQVIYLTATLPPTLQPSFLQLAGLDERTLTVCRDKHTARTNIAYSVLDYERGTLDSSLVQLVAKKREQYGANAQIIVYCPSVPATKHLAQCLGSMAFYADMGSEEDKTRHVRAFASGAVTLCTATTMLGLGLDAAGVRVVIHVAMPACMRHFVQESGRAGRTGLLSESVVLREFWSTKSGSTKSHLPLKLDPPARDFLTGPGCRRVAIDAHMDGRLDRKHCGEGESACDRCAQRAHGAKQTVAIAAENADIANLVREEAHNVAFVKSVAKESRHLDILRRRREEQMPYELERLKYHLQH
jgi:superfamily II DNA helicase RecQ